MLEQDPLMRIYVMSRSEQEHFILVVIHHIIFDGSSFGMFIQSFLDAYKNVVQGKTSTVLPPAASYGDFVKWEQTMLASAEGRSIVPTGHNSCQVLYRPWSCHMTALVFRLKAWKHKHILNRFRLNGSNG